jgi:uncharacterized protein YhfF
VIPANVAEFWEAYAETVGGADETRLYEAFYFGDGEELANSLAALVLSGTKRATAGSLWSFEARGKRPPLPGDLSIVTDWNGTPLCIIETESVEVVAFDQVTTEFAATEGEGDGSLTYWRKAHREYFTRECAGAGREFSEEMLVVCERFHMVYRSAE